MTLRLRLAATFWVAIAILLAAYSNSGGDASIVGGFLFLFWTAPFGPIWQFWIYDGALKFLEAPVAQFVGDALSIIVGAMFWFILMPRLSRKQLPKRNE